MVRILTRSQIEQIAKGVDIVGAMERAFEAYSTDRARVAAVGHLDFGERGDVCVKSGFMVDGDRFVVKVAGGFPGNLAAGRSTSQGLMMVCSTTTGAAEAVLLDEGWLTDLRTGAAGGVSAKWLAPKSVSSIAILGSGIQARLQGRFVAEATGCTSLSLWGRNPGRTESCADDLRAHGLDVRIHARAEDATADASVLVTTTPSRAPIISESAVSPGSLIIAMGADGVGKQELDPTLLGRAELVVADSIAQCSEFGESAHAIASGFLQREDMVELGSVVGTRNDDARAGGERTVVVDLTGIAAQDVVAACTILDRSEPADRSSDGRSPTPFAGS